MFVLLVVLVRLWVFLFGFVGVLGCAVAVCFSLVLRLWPYLVFLFCLACFSWRRYQFCSRSFSVGCAFFFVGVFGRCCGLLVMAGWFCFAFRGFLCGCCLALVAMSSCVLPCCLPCGVWCGFVAVACLVGGRAALRFWRLVGFGHFLALSFVVCSCACLFAWLFVGGLWCPFSFLGGFFFWFLLAFRLGFGWDFFFLGLLLR